MITVGSIVSAEEIMLPSSWICEYGRVCRSDENQSKSCGGIM